MRFKSLFFAVMSTVSFSIYAAETTTTSAQPAASATTKTDELAQANVAPIANMSSTEAAKPSGNMLSNNTDRMSYAIGVDIGRNFKSQAISLNSDLMSQGIKDGLGDGKLLMTPKEMQETLMNFQKELIEKRRAIIQQTSEKNKTEGINFLEGNKKKEGVVTLSDGLQYKVVKEGAGELPKDGDTVTVNYEGSFPNGQVFDSSYARGKPSTFPVNAVIPGWSEALKLMKPGAEWMLYIPAALAYGDHGAGPIGPNQVLVFKVQLISAQTSSKGDLAPKAEVNVDANAKKST